MVVDRVVQVRYYLTMATRPKKTPPKEPLKVVTIKLTPALETTLAQLSQEASDAIGRPVSGSAVVRALIQYAGEQPAPWSAAAVHPLIETEIAAGRVWGSRKR